MNPCADEEDSELRNMTPAFTQLASPDTLATRATICPSPVSDVDAKLKASCVPQTSAPAPRTVNTPVLMSKFAPPAAPTAPMSASVQPCGSDPVLDVTVIRAVAEVVVAPASSDATAVSA